MDTAVFTADLTPWLTQVSEILYVATAGLALFVIGLSCVVGRHMTPQSTKPRGHAHP